MWVGRCGACSSGVGQRKGGEKKPVGRMEHSPKCSMMFNSREILNCCLLAPVLCVAGVAFFALCTLLMHWINWLFFRKWQHELAVRAKWVSLEMDWVKAQIEGRIGRKVGVRHFNNRNHLKQKKKKKAFFLLWSFQQLNEAVHASWFDLSARPHVRLLRLRVFPERSNEPFYDSLSHCWFLLPSLQTF